MCVCVCVCERVCVCVWVASLVYRVFVCLWDAWWVKPWSLILSVNTSNLINPLSRCLRSMVIAMHECVRVVLVFRQEEPPGSAYGAQTQSEWRRESCHIPWRTLQTGLWNTSGVWINRHFSGGFFWRGSADLPNACDSPRSDRDTVQLQRLAWSSTLVHCLDSLQYFSI